MQLPIEQAIPVRRRPSPAVSASLSPYPGEESDPLDRALKNLQDCDFQQRWENAKLFPKIGERAIAPLVDLLTADSTPRDTRWFIIRILGELPHRESAIALGGIARQSEDEELAMMAAEALAGIGRPAIELLAGLLDNPETRLLAVGSLSRIRRPEIVTPLLTVVTDESPEIRAIALEALGSFHDERIVAVILAALGDLSAEPRRQATIAAGYLAPRYPEVDFVSRLAPLLGDLDLEIGRAAAGALGRIGTTEAIDCLCWALQSPFTPAVLKLAIVRVLGWIENEAALEAVAKAFPSLNEPVLAEMVTILGRQKSPRCRSLAIGVLLELIGGRSVTELPTAIRQALSVTLGELADPRGRGFLLSLADDSEASVRLHALWALKKLDRSPA